jgi:hypothetical protein
VPRPIQEEAFRKGLIPYLPGEKDNEEVNQQPEKNESN